MNSIDATRLVAMLLLLKLKQALCTHLDLKVALRIDVHLLVLLTPLVGHDDVNQNLWPDLAI